MKNIWLKIAYDGTDFCGWQRQPGSRTVCGELEALLSSLTGQDIKLNGTSRTDAGVHALGQCASFTADLKIPVEKLARVMNDRLAGDRLESVSDIRIVCAREMPEDFHTRFSSEGKRYIYKIRNCEEPDIFSRNYCYQVLRPLDVSAMRKAAEYITGEHDFACFMSSGSTPQKTTVRTVYSLDIAEKDIPKGREIALSIEGNGFLYNMVRIITGTLVEAGLGKRTPESVGIAIEKKDRALAGHVAPAHGLYLDEVFYDKKWFE